MDDSTPRQGLHFGKWNRLTASVEFARVRTEGRAVRGQLLTIGLLQANAGPAWCAGFVTSKRVGGAVVRNLLRRRLRDIVRHHQHSLEAGVWLVVIARPAAAQATYGALEDEWLRLARRASILRP